MKTFVLGCLYKFQDYELFIREIFLMAVFLISKFAKISCQYQYLTLEAPDRPLFPLKMIK